MTARLTFFALGRQIARPLALLLSFGGAQAVAAPWLEPGDERARHHLQVLADSGAIRTPITGWPVMWSNVKHGLDSINPGELPADALVSYRYLRHELRRSMTRVTLEQRSRVGNSPNAIGSFATDTREQRELRLGITVTAQKTAMRLQASVVGEPLDGQRYRLDESYLAHLVGNWAVGVGSVERWWGPGWESSLILSHNARPAPGVFVQRSRSTPADIAPLRWLGPWQLTSFLSRLDSARSVENPLFWGVRASFMPHSSLEVGLSRTAIWSGRGQQTDISGFGKLVFTADDDAPPGHQLSAVDFRWGYRLGNTTQAVYGQLAGGEGSDGMPTRSIGMAGIELATHWRDSHLRFSLEGQNTLANFYDSDNRIGNAAYEHDVYTTGYRYKGRPLGAATDNDAEAVTLRSQVYFGGGSQLSVSWAHLRINTDGSNRDGAGGNVFGADLTVASRWSIDYAVPINNHAQLQLGAFRYSNDLALQNLHLRSGGQMTVTTRF